MNNTKIAITKLDAARRQLETAVILWFHDCDPVSIHTLAAAAYQIIFDIKQKHGGRSMMMDLECIRDEHRKMLRNEFAKYKNFFKHADTDPSKTLHFPPKITACFILDAAWSYHEMAHQQLPLFQLFFFYLSINEPEMFGEDFANKFRNTIPADKIPKLGKREFFQHVLPKLAKIESV